MKTRILFTKFYQDSYIRTLSPTERFIFLYLITNSHVGLSDSYEADIGLIQFETGVNSSQIESSFKKFEKEGKFIYYEGWVKILNYEKYNQYRGEKNETAKNKELELIPNRVSEYFDRVSIGYSSTRDTSINHKSEIINKKSETRNKKSEDKYIETSLKILKGYNTVFKKNYKSTNTWFKNYVYWRKTYSDKEIATAIVKAREDSWWKDKLTLEKLFRTRNSNGECDYIGELLNS